MKDDIYSKPEDPLVKFTFDRQVADVFPDMIQRSVPGYTTTVAMIGVLAAQYAKDNTKCYDLGCSLGASTLAMRKHIENSVAIIAVDNSPDMVAKCKKVIDRDHSNIPVEVICDDILNVRITSASVVVLNFTLQFLIPDLRNKVLQNIYDGLNAGGILILSEKICFAKHDAQELQTSWHHAFKKANGYSELEIAQKRTALENILVPETEKENIDRLNQAGFKSVYKWFQCFNFVSFVGKK